MTDVKAGPIARAVMFHFDVDGAGTEAYAVASIYADHFFRATSKNDKWTESYERWLKDANT